MARRNTTRDVDGNQCALPNGGDMVDPPPPTDAAVVAAIETLVRRFGPAATSAPQPKRPEGWASVADAAAHAAVSEDTVRGWIDRDLVPTGRCNRILRVRLSDIDRLLLTPAASNADEEKQPKVSDRAAQILEQLTHRGETDG